MKWDVDAALDSLNRETEALERIRQGVVNRRSEGTKKMFLSVGGGLAGGVLAVAITQHLAGLLIGVFAALIGGIVVYSKYFSGGKAQYRSLFKTQLITKLIRWVEPEMNYDPYRGLSEGMFQTSQLFNKRPDRYASEDLIHGIIGKTKLMFCEVHAEEKYTTTDSKGNTQTRWRDIFRGVLVCADFHKEFRSKVAVMPDFAEKTFGFLGRKLQKLGGNVQRMENLEFEEMFVVRGSDPIESRYILTPAMQERLVSLRKRVGGGLRIVFYDSHVWLAIPNRKNWFEGSLWHSAHDRSQAKELMGQLRCVFEIVEELDLNTRIWTKQ